MVSSTADKNHGQRESPVLAPEGNVIAFGQEIAG